MLQIIEKYLFFLMVNSFSKIFVRVELETKKELVEITTSSFCFTVNIRDKQTILQIHHSNYRGNALTSLLYNKY